MGKSREELADLFKGVKETVDNAYDATMRKHGAENADAALLTFFRNDIVSYFTNDEGSRDNMRELLGRPLEVLQILVDYAMSSFILNDMQCDIPYGQLINYSGNYKGKLNYKGKMPVKVVALATAFSPDWAVDLLVCNPKLKEGLVANFIQERYVEDRRDELDSVIYPRLVRFIDTDERTFINKDKLNAAIQCMNEANMMSEYIPPTRRTGTTKK